MLRLLALAAATTLATPSTPEPRVEAAIQALRRDGSLKVRAQAAIVLGQRGAAEAVPALREAVARDDAAAVRLAAVGALAKLGARTARPTLRAASDADPDGAVRTAAARALEGLGPISLALEEPGGTPGARGPARESLIRHLQGAGFTVTAAGAELRVKSTVVVEVSAAGGKTVIAVKTTLLVVDGDGHLDMLEGSARATVGGTGVSGTVPEAKLAAYSAKAIDAAVRGLCEELATRLGRR